MKVSVVIPTYNRQDLVLQAVQSACAQTARAHEIIVVVDGSTDGTADALRRHYPEVIVYEQPNRGLAIARNAGLSLATGDWVCFLDDDDLWHPRKLAFAKQYAEEYPDCDAMIGPCWYFADDHAGPDERIGLKRDFVADGVRACVQEADQRGTVDSDSADRLRLACSDVLAILRRNQGLYVSSMAVKRNLLITAGGSSPSFMDNEDWIMLLNVARLTRWHVLNEKLVFSRLHPAQLIGGSVLSEFVSIGGLISAWYTGRPLEVRLDANQIKSALESLAPSYRTIVQGLLWTLVRKGRLRDAKSISGAARMILPRSRDRLYTFVPPPITWRIERYLLGMHK